MQITIVLFVRDLNRLVLSRRIEYFQRKDKNRKVSLEIEISHMVIRATSISKLIYKRALSSVSDALDSRRFTDTKCINRTSLTAAQSPAMSIKPWAFPAVDDIASPPRGIPISRYYSVPARSLENDNDDDDNDAAESHWVQSCTSWGLRGLGRRDSGS